MLKTSTVLLKPQTTIHRSSVELIFFSLVWSILWFWHLFIQNVKQLKFYSFEIKNVHGSQPSDEPHLFCIKKKFKKNLKKLLEVTYIFQCLSRKKADCWVSSPDGQILMLWADSLIRQQPQDNPFFQEVTCCIMKEKDSHDYDSKIQNVTCYSKQYCAGFVFRWLIVGWWLVLIKVNCPLTWIQLHPTFSFCQHKHILQQAVWQVQ